VLSLSRLPLGLVFAWGLRATPEGQLPLWPAAALVLAGLTDALDGAWARHSAAKTRPRIDERSAGAGGGVVAPEPGRGSWLDPICDKLFVATVLASLFLLRHASLSLLALIAARELAQLPLTLVYRAVPFLRHWLHYDFTASVFGKLATVAQFGSIAVLLVDPAAARLPAYAAFGMGLLALGDYLVRAWRLGRQRHAAAHDQSASPPRGPSSSFKPPG